MSWMHFQLNLAGVIRSCQLASLAGSLILHFLPLGLQNLSADLQADFWYAVKKEILHWLMQAVISYSTISLWAISVVTGTIAILKDFRAVFYMSKQSDTNFQESNFKIQNLHKILPQNDKTWYNTK